MKKKILAIVVCLCVVAIGIGITVNDVNSALGDPTQGSTTVAVLFNGKVTGYFAEVQNIGSENAVVEHKVVNQSGQEVVNKIPGNLTYNTITLTREITSNTELWDWRAEVESGQIDSARIDGTISLFDQEGSLISEWNLSQVWPTKIKQTVRESDGVYIEEVTIVCESLVRTQ